MANNLGLRTYKSPGCPHLDPHGQPIPAERGSERSDGLHQNFTRCPCCKTGYFLYHPKPKNHYCPYCEHLTVG